ncbi:MAG: hypothetical protein IPP88_08940 [Betaproteobacteria bacterium]|nr:hypothetical protein [Betaproteobacteria bacterium]
MNGAGDNTAGVVEKQLASHHSLRPREYSDGAAITMPVWRGQLPDAGAIPAQGEVRAIGMKI